MTKGVSKLCISSRSRSMFSTWSRRINFIFCEGLVEIARHVILSNFLKIPGIRVHWMIGMG